jgi:PKD repeat protein
MKLSGYFIGLILFITLMGTASAVSANMPITVDNNSLPDGYQIRVLLPYENGMSANYSDVRFYANNTAGDGGTELSYYLVDVYADTALFYVRLPQHTTTIYAEWDIPGETTSESNGSAVFDWFTGFDGTGAYNTSEWQTIASYYQHDGVLEINTSARMCGKIAMNPLNQTIIWRASSVTANGHNSGLTNNSSSSQSGTDRAHTQIVDSPLKLSNKIYTTSGTNPYFIPNMTVGANEYLTFRIFKTAGKNTYASVRNSTGAYAAVSRLNDSYGTDEALGYAYITGNGANHNMSVDFVAHAKQIYPEPIVTVNSVAQVGPVANFTSNVTKAAAPVTVQFNDTSSNSPTSWLWNFGDGNISYEQNPVHTFSTATNYTVSLTVNNAYGSDVRTVTKYIHAYGTRFTWQGRDWVVRTTTGNPGGNYWGKYQDSAYIDGNDRQHLLISQINGTWYSSETISVDSYRYGTFTWKDYNSPLMDQDHNIVVGMFTYNYSDGAAHEIDIEPSRWGNDVDSTIWSDTGSANDILWLTNQPWNGANNRKTFVAEGSQYNSAKNVTYQFEWYPNRIHWLVTAENGATIADWICTNVSGIPKVFSKIELNYWCNDTLYGGVVPITGNAPFDGQQHEIVFDSFTYTPLSSEVNLTANDTYHSLPFAVQFFDASTTNTTDWNWNFGDGTTSTEQNPTHTYTVAGTYTVSLEATNESGTFTKTDVIDVEEAPEQEIIIRSTDTAHSLKTTAVSSSNMSIFEGIGWWQNGLDSINSGITLGSLMVLVLAGAAILRFLGYI